ncbi:MAG TPA: chromosome segregation protein SMC [Clostridiales bacterium]|nr:chromosome segregation protein SMC [Clostridiales bacterium]
MFLKSLELQGFKSFPDRTVLNFGSGLTSVVGPNGSGKSNISDAVRWVLGEQSTKNLRGGKMEDVIFSGTEVRKAVGFAEVTLRLDNKDRSLNFDNDEVAVTRRYYRSGESEYVLNSEVVRLKDIHELFMGTGLGRDGYSLVSQGRIADLISSKSNQRREMLEEAAGISQFRYRRTDATRRLTQAEENLVRLRDIFAELEARVGPLKAQSEKAQKFLLLSEEKKDLEIGLWLKSIEKATQGLKEQEDKLALVSGQYDFSQNTLEQLEEEIEEVIAAAQGVTLEIEAVRQSAAGFEEEAAQIDGQIAVEENTIEHNRQSIERITRDMEAAADTESHLGDQIKAINKEIESLIETIRLKKLELENSARDMSGVKEENARHDQKATELSHKIAGLTAKASELRIAMSTAQSSKEEVSARIEAIDAALLSRADTIAGLESQKDECAKSTQEYRETVTGLSNSVSGYRLRVNSRLEKTEAHKKELDRLNLEIHQKNARAKMLDDLEKNMEGYMGSVKAVMREAKRGTLRGIHGTVSQLISVDDAYSVAIETALGAAVQNIVTDNENDAKRAINYLKESREGRATFLPISSVSGKDLNERGLESCTGFIDLAHKLLDYDKKYTEIIKSLLARTAIVDNMDNAVEIAKKYSYRIRIVTLDGQVMNAGGSMTGGSRGQNAGILSRANEIESLRFAADGLQKKYDKMLDEYKALGVDLSAAQAELDGALADLARAQEDLIRKESELELLQGRYDTALSASEELRDEKARAEKRIVTLNQETEAALAEISDIDTQIKELEGEADKLNFSRRELDSRREELAELESSVNLQILAAQKDMEAKEEAVASLKRRIASHSGRLEDLNEEISLIAQNSIDLKAKIVDLREAAAALRSRSAASKEEISLLVEKRSGLEAKSTELRARARTLSDEKEKLGSEQSRLSERRATLEKELEDAQNKLYDEYQLTRREALELNIVIEEPAKAQRTLNEIRSKIRALGTVNVGAVEEYKEVSERHEFLGTQIKDIEASKDELTRLIEELTERMAVRFREEFNKINMHFGETFRELFRGGKAELVLENAQDILECAIEIKVQPPGKNVQNIDLLSGGEKGLAAIALLFAILKVTPAPFCIFDEVEAALDENNVALFAKYVRRMTKNTQFILITHRRGTMEEADMLYGVTMQEDGVSKLLELKTAEMAKKLGIA